MGLNYDDPIYESWLTQPIGHSTVLVNGNHQSQRVGDHLNFAPGFHDHAYISHFLDGKHTSFVQGGIGRLYWDEVSQLSRNVLYLKPRTVLMLDVAVPAEDDATITLLYQTARLDDIKADHQRSSIAKDGATLHVHHLSPQDIEAKAVETPHYLNTLRNVRPLEREGMLTVSSETKGKPLVIANLLTSTATGNTPEVTTQEGEGFVWGEVSGQQFAFSTDLGQRYQGEGFITDALALSWDHERVFVAMARVYEDERIKLSADTPVTFEFSSTDGITYYTEQDGQLTIGVQRKPSSVIHNGKPVKRFSYDAANRSLQLPVPKGQGSIVIR